MLFFGSKVVILGDSIPLPSKTLDFSQRLCYTDKNDKGLFEDVKAMLFWD